MGSIGVSVGVVQRRLRTSLATRLVGHFGMGAVLGSVLGLCQVRFNIAHIGEIIENTFNPGETLAVFVGSLILNFAIGAALTGFILIEMGEASGKNNL